MAKHFFGITVVILTLLGILMAGPGAYQLVTVSAQEPGPVTAPNAKDALNLALTQYNLQVSSDQNFRITETQIQADFAYAIAEAFDQATGHRVEEEVFVALLARRSPSDNWQAIAPNMVPNEEYNNWLATFPEALLDASTNAFLHLSEPRSHEIKAQDFADHRLPWTSQKTGFLTKKDNCYFNGSGVTCSGSGHETQLDFNVEGSGTSGDIYASKPGTVVFVKESSNSGDCNYNNWKQANMVVVQHGPSEFSWYVHLSYNSVPVGVGQTVGFGTKIGVEGNTGYSCGTHLHYMASTGHNNWTDPNNPNDAPWATGITAVNFSEASWASLTVGSWYTSQNEGGSPSGCANYSDSGIVLFRDANCGGDTKKFYQTGFANLNDFNDAATSIYVPSSWSVRVYEHADRGGASRCIDHTMWDLNQDYYDNSSTKIAGTISSVDVFNNSTCSGTPPPPPTDKVRLYSEANFGGSEVWNGGVGFSNGPSANSYSMKVPSGWSVKTWSQDNRVGDYRCWTGSVNNLQDHGWQLKIQSVEVYSSIACPTPPPPGGQWTAKYYPTRTCWDDHSQCTGNYTYSENLSVPGNGVIIDKNWGIGSPGGSTPNDNWTGFFEATLNFNIGSYVFYADHDDGLKLNIEGYGEHNKDSSGSSSRLCHGDDGYYLSGSKNIKVYLREDGGDARIKIWYDNNTAACRKPDPPTLWAPGNQTTTSDTTPIFSWLSVSGATEYNIQVDNNSNFSSPEVNNQKTTSTTYTPGSALAVGTYYWRVQAKNQYNNWSDWSSTWQVTIVTIPSIPTNAQASDGTYTDKVRVTWNAVSGATGYEVWRHTSSSSSLATRIAYSVTGTSYDDTGAVSGQTYYYWIRACNASVCSGHSNYDTGWRNVAPPTNVQASDGTYTDKVRVTWNAVSGATGYEVWRHTSNSSSSAIRIASSVTGTSYDDTGAVSGQTYYYWIKAKTLSGTGGFSVPDSGYRASAPEEYWLFLPLLLKGQ